MISIESTPEFVSSVHEPMDRGLQIVRKNLGRPLGLAEKALLSHLDDPDSTGMERGKSYVQLRPGSGAARILPTRT
jgi:aconitate hydratase